MALAILMPLAACSGGGAPTLVMPLTLEPTPTLAPTANPRTGLLVNEPESFEGYTLFSPAHGRHAYLIDNQGNVAHRYRSGIRLARLLDNGNALSSGNIESDPDGNIVWDFRHPQHHDLLKLSNGNVLILSDHYVSLEDAIALGANPDSVYSLTCPLSRIRGTRIVEARPTGPDSAEIVWEWSVFDHLIQDFDPGKPNYGAVADHPERVDVNFALAGALCKNDGIHWTHANALDYNEALDQIMITVRHFSEIWVIDHSASREEAAGSAGGSAGKGGDLLYRWGNPRAHGAGTPADQRLFWPHAGHWIPEDSPGAGNVLIFNNGNEYHGFERGYSSVDEFALPSEGYAYRLDAGAAYGPNAPVWTYIADPPESFYAYKESGAQRLPNGNTLIADGPAGRIFEVARAGETVWEFVSPLGSVYRAYRYPPDHPGLRGLDLTPWRTAYRAAVGGEPLARSTFDLYLVDGALIYVKEQCNPGESGFFLHVIPERMDGQEDDTRQHSVAHLVVDFFKRGALFDGKCVVWVPLPDYPVAAIRTGQQTSDGRTLWSSAVWTNPEPYRTAYRNAVEQDPLARSTFNLYAADGALIYVKEQCGQSDITHRFFLHIVPGQAADLPGVRRQYGFENAGFDFFARGALFDGKCAARVPLPDYPIASIRTGQFIKGEGELWSAEIEFP